MQAERYEIYCFSNLSVLNSLYRKAPISYSRYNFEHIILWIIKLHNLQIELYASLTMTSFAIVIENPLKLSQNLYFCTLLTTWSLMTWNILTFWSTVSNWSEQEMHWAFIKTETNMEKKIILTFPSFQLAWMAEVALSKKKRKRV